MVFANSCAIFLHLCCAPFSQSMWDIDIAGILYIHLAKKEPLISPSLILTKPAWSGVLYRGVWMDTWVVAGALATPFPRLLFGASSKVMRSWHALEGYVKEVVWSVSASTQRSSSVLNFTAWPRLISSAKRHLLALRAERWKLFS